MHGKQTARCRFLVYDHTSEMGLFSSVKTWIGLCVFYTFLHTRWKVSFAQVENRKSSTHSRSSSQRRCLLEVPSSETLTSLLQTSGDNIVSVCLPTSE